MIKRRVGARPRRNTVARARTFGVLLLWVASVWTFTLVLWQFAVVRNNAQIVLGATLSLVPMVVYVAASHWRRTRLTLGPEPTEVAEHADPKDRAPERDPLYNWGDESTSYLTPRSSRYAASPEEQTLYGAGALHSSEQRNRGRQAPLRRERDFQQLSGRDVTVSAPPVSRRPRTELEPADQHSQLRLPPKKRTGSITGFEFNAATWTDAGPRDENQDRALILPRLLAIADGVGGRSSGAAAAREALQTVAENMNRPHANPGEAMLRANEALRARHNEDAVDRGRATTLDIVHFDDADDIAGSHVGDSRVYVLPAGSDELVRLTTDHSHGNTLTRSIGGSISVSPDVWIHEPSAGDLLVVATDGLWKSRLDDLTINRILLTHRGSPPQLVARILGERALAAAVDNITVIVAEVISAH